MLTEYSLRNTQGFANQRVSTYIWVALSSCTYKTRTCRSLSPGKFHKSHDWHKNQIRKSGFHIPQSDDSTGVFFKYPVDINEIMLGLLTILRLSPPRWTFIVEYVSTLTCCSVYGRWSQRKCCSRCFTRIIPNFRKCNNKEKRSHVAWKGSLLFSLFGDVAKFPFFDQET